jgi:hypothetical protein
MQEKIGALGLQLAQEVQQVDQRPAQPIHRPGRNHVVVVIFIGVVVGNADVRPVTRMRQGPGRDVQLRIVLPTDDRITISSSVDPSRWASNHYFRPAMYDLS